MDSRYILDGLIEIDDAFIGGSGGKRGRGTKKAKVVVSVSITEEGKPQFAQMDVVSDHSQTSLLSHIQKSVVNGSKIKTDGFKGYNNLIREGYAHKVVYSPKMLPWVHILISNVKGFILGTYHGVSKRRLFGRLLNAVINACPVTYAELTK